MGNLFLSSSRPPRAPRACRSSARLHPGVEPGADRGPTPPGRFASARQGYFHRLTSFKDGERQCCIHPFRGCRGDGQTEGLGGIATRYDRRPEDFLLRRLSERAPVDMKGRGWG